MTPIRATAPYDWPALLALIQRGFAFMQDRIDPPSSMHRLTPATIAEQARTGEVWAIEATGTPIACLFLSARPGRLYLSKLAVNHGHRGRGLARRLVETAEARAGALGLKRLTLASRIELVETHAALKAMGFEKFAATAHDGFDRPTSFALHKHL